MKAKLFFTCILMATMSQLFSQITSIPDPNFEQALIDGGIDTDVTLNGQVLTSDISGITQLYVNSLSISDLTGIEDFISLTLLNAHDNLLTSVDLTNNVNLLTVVLAFNSLTSLNVSHCTQLVDLRIFDNNLTGIDVSNNVNLEHFQIQNNPLTFLDVSKNPNLNFFACLNTDVDGINMKSGGNTNLPGNVCYLTGNPNLTCIQVDDAAWSTANWYQIDPGASFSEDCNYVLGINDASLNKVAVYPNPLIDMISVKAASDYEYSLFNLSGQVIISGKLTLGENTLNLNNMPSGIYLLKIMDENISHTKKLVKR